MARESQGLQVLLIVFIMLTVVLGVTTFLYNKRGDEAAKSVTAERLATQQAEGEKKATAEENQVLKTLIGFPERSTIEEIKKQFAEDMQTYGSERKSDPDTDKSGALAYRRLLAGTYKVLQERTDELLHVKASLADLQREIQEPRGGQGRTDQIAHRGLRKTGRTAQKDFGRLPKWTTGYGRANRPIRKGD